jgi:PAS domain S-box-containing protein
VAVMHNQQKLTGIERFFDPDDIIVSKTDLKGHITYGNRTFIAMSGYAKDELIGAPHNILRHEDMPRCVFKLLWDRLQHGEEVFAWVVNKCKNGDHYWVFAHVTPSRRADGSTVGYHSTRRVPNAGTVRDVIRPLYAELLNVERRNPSPKHDISDSMDLLTKKLSDQAVSYDEFVFSLQH